MSKFIPQGLGWIPDLPDPRDYASGHPEIQTLLRQLQPSSDKLDDDVDLRYGDEGEVFFTDAEDQGALHASSAFAVLSLIEYFERRVHGRTFEGSRLFLYKVARNLQNKRSRVSGDTGASLRTTLKALRQFGAPDEALWPYDLDRFDTEPTPFVYQAARRFRNLRFFRIGTDSEAHVDQPYETRWAVLTALLSSGFPLVFGFAVPSSLSTDPNIPHRPKLDDIRGGQCAVAIGYKLNHFGRNQHALLTRLSWGKQWGNNGVGWLPASYIEGGLARDFTCLICSEWAASGELSRPQKLLQRNTAIT